MTDLKAFVEVLTVLCGDSREPHELRVAEAAAKERCAALERQLQASGRRGACGLALVLVGWLLCPVG